MRQFEYDEAKSAANLAKHGIDFVAAQRVWSDRDSVEVPARSATEPRYAQIGRVEGKLWSVFFTPPHRCYTHYFRTPGTPIGDAAL